MYMTFSLIRRRLTALRGLAAATLGALSGVIVTYYGLKGFFSLIISLALSFLMIFICIGKGIRFINYVKYTVILWGIGALLAGGVSLICSLGNVSASHMSVQSGASALLVLVLGIVVVRFILKVLISAPKPEECLLEIKCFGMNTKVSALVDSGNLVTEQLSGLPVIFVKKNAFAKCSAASDVEFLSQGTGAMNMLSPDTKRRVRVVSVQRTSETKLLVGIITSEIYIVTDGQRINTKAVIVIENTADYAGYDAIVPQSILF